MIHWLKRVWAWATWEPTWPVVVAPPARPLQPLTLCTAIVNRPYREPR